MTFWISQDTVAKVYRCSR